MLAVQGRIAENTCCSRMRRAINCVYCPPKSRTTMPCRVLTMPPAFSLCSPDFTAATPLLDVIYPADLSQNEINQFLQEHHYFHSLFARDLNRNARVVPRLRHSFVFAKAIVDQHFPAQPPIDLNDHLDLLFARQVFAIR